MFHLKICKETIYDEIKRILRVLIIFFRDGDQNMMLLMFTEKEKLRIEGIKIGRWNAYFIKKLQMIIQIISTTTSLPLGPFILWFKKNSIPKFIITKQRKIIYILYEMENHVVSLRSEL